MPYEVLWYLVLGVAVLAYTVLDGFDLGVGILHLFARGDQQRRIFLNAIGPVWDGNSVWIIIVVGGMFAGFPDVYASILSGFYIPFMALISGFIFRAVAIEFRSKRSSNSWRTTWDVVFSLSSHMVAFVIGLILGNMIQGIALNESQDYIGTFSDFFRPYSLLVGFTSVSLFAMHGTIYLAMKTEDRAHEVVRRWIVPAVITFITLYIITTIASLLYMPHMIERFIEMPALGIVPFLAFLSIFNILLQVRKRNDGWAFISSSLSIAFLLLIYALGTFPVIVRSSMGPSFDITIFNSASSHKTLGVLLTIVMIGLPFVLAYGFWVYRVFRGKVKLDDMSY